jgi:thiamine-monophosphate kinase
MTIDEDAFIAGLLPRLIADDGVVIPSGDDCAALAWTDGTLLLLAVDQVSSGHHYVADCPPELAGRKLLARNLSDIAAMGGRPRYALLAQSVPTDCAAEWVEAFVQGVIDLGNDYDVKLIGGDLAGGGAKNASLTIIGDVSTDTVCRRSGAAGGERIFVTGDFGGSLASDKHLRFMPRIDEGAWLAGHGATAMIDVSDGLLKDLERICAASDVGAVVLENRIPRTEISGTSVDVDRAWLDGEDYELIIAVSPDIVPVITREWPFETRLTDIGGFVGSSAHGPCVADQFGEDIAAKYGVAFDHFGG